MKPGDALVALLTDVLAELRAIRSSLDERRSQTSRVLSRADRDLLARLLPAIAGALASEAFTIRDLVHRDAPGLRLILRGLSTRRLGKLFARATGQNCAGLTVVRLGRAGSAAVWQVRAIVSSVSDVSPRRPALAPTPTRP